MSWYNLAKFGQIWNVKYRRDSVQSCLEALYQLTYKYQQMQIQNFKGYPKRQENILIGIEKESRQIIADLVDLLLPVFEKWLAGHALTNPKAWAANIMREQDESEGSSPSAIADMINGFSYGGVGGPKDLHKVDATSIAEQLDLPIKNKQAPAFANWFHHTKVEIREADADNRDEDDTRSEEELDAYYRDMDFSEYFSTYWNDDWEDFFDSVAQFTDITEFAAEIAEFALFPAWYEYWQQQGIDETRDRLENAYQMLKQVESQPIAQALATINIVINTCHQTGNMLDYIIEATSDYKGELYRAMNNLSNLTHKSPEMMAWNKDLRQVGTHIPRPPRPVKPKVPEEPSPNEAMNPMFNQVV